MFKLICITCPLAFISLLFVLWSLVERNDIESGKRNMTVFPTIPRYKPLHMQILNRVRRESKKKKTPKKKGPPGKKIARTTFKRRTLDIGSEEYEMKKYGNANVNPAQYAYELRMSASREIKSDLLRYVRKRFFNITEHRSKLSALEILKNESKVLYDNYMKIINKSTTINYWKILRDARYNNTEPDIDYSAEIREGMKTFDHEGGTAPTAFLTVAQSIVNYYLTCASRMLYKVGTGPVIYGTGSDY